jgi:hypothetical protein
MAFLSSKMLRALTAIRDLRCVIFKGIADLSDPAETIALKCDEVLDDLRACLLGCSYCIFAHELVPKGGAVDLIVLVHQGPKQIECDTLTGGGREVL